MGKNRHGGKIKGDTPDLTCDGHSSQMAYKIWRATSSIALKIDTGHIRSLKRGLTTLMIMKRATCDITKLTARTRTLLTVVKASKALYHTTMFSLSICSIGYLCRGEAIGLFIAWRRRSMQRISPQVVLWYGLPYRHTSLYTVYCKLEV